MTTAIVLALIAFLAMLGLLEVARYRRARRGDEELPYPARRLVRRLTASALLIAALGATLAVPDLRPIGRLTLLSLILVVSLLALGLLWRDLRETSIEAVRHSERLRQLEARRMEQLIEEARRRKPPEHENE